MRNYKIDFYKIILTIIVIVGHSRRISMNCNFVAGGSKAVECFFIISGYYLMVSYTRRRGYYKNSVDDIISFAGGKLKYFYPHYIISFFIVFLTRQAFVLYSIYRQDASIRNIITNFAMNIYKALPEMTGIQMFGLLDTNNYHNQPTWYLCSMLIAIIILYCLLAYNEKLSQYILIPIIGLTLLGRRFTSGIAFGWAEWEVLATSGVLRALSDISLGVMCYSFAIHISTFKLTKITRIVFSFIEIAGWIMLCYGCHVNIDANGAIWVIFAFVILTISLSDISYLGDFFKIKGFKQVSEFFFSIYMTHYAGIAIVKNLFYEKPYFHNLPIFIIVCIAIAAVEIQCVKGLNNILMNIKSRRGISKEKLS